MNIRIEVWAGHKIRFVEKDSCEWWAVASDVTDALGIKNTSEAVNGNPKRNAKGLNDTQKDVCKLYTLGGEQDVLVISETGIYKLIFRSHKKEAEEFQDWVCDVIKTLRQSTGLEGFQIFRILDKDHQKEAMARLNGSLQKPNKQHFIKANTIADKAISNLYGYPKMIKKDNMAPEMLVDRQPILEDTVNLMGLADKYGLNISVSETIYNGLTNKKTG